MNLSISNIAWELSDDRSMYEIMKKYKYAGLEIAPTRVLGEKPYDNLTNAQTWQKELMVSYGFVVASMQSIWYGRQEKLFGSEEERRILVDYTKKAIDFASAIGCKNLVFGCPRNRNNPNGENREAAVSFFRELGDYAMEKGTVVGMEANPPIYNTNFINDTVSAFELIDEVGSEGFRLNLDVGTMIQNEENVDELCGRVKWINHVHISEPGLKMIENRALHKELAQLLNAEDYQGFVSIEMGKQDDLKQIEGCMAYVGEVFK